MTRSTDPGTRNPALPYVHGIPAHVYRTAYRPLRRAGGQLAIGVARAALVADG